MSIRMVQREQNHLSGEHDRMSPAHQSWLSDPSPLGLYGGDANLYRYVGDDPTNAIDPTGERSQYKFYDPMEKGIKPPSLPYVKTGVYIAHTEWKKRVDPVGHTFLIVDGVGYGFFEVMNHAFGTGSLHSNDLDVYPLKRTQAELDAVAPGQFYSLASEIYVNSEEVDPVRFKLAVMTVIKQREAKPGSYSVFGRNCTTFAYDTINMAIRAAWKTDYLHKRQDPYWFGNIRSDAEEALAGEVEKQLAAVSQFRFIPPRPLINAKLPTQSQIRPPTGGE